MQVGDLVKHIAMSDDFITPGLVLGATFCGNTITVLWAGDTLRTYCSRGNLEVINAV